MPPYINKTMSLCGKKMDLTVMDATLQAENHESISILLQIMQQQAEERTQLHDDLCEEHWATEERFNLLLQTMYQSGQAHTAPLTPPIAQAPTSAS